MRDVQVLLLVLILAHMGLDYLSSAWRAKARSPRGRWLDLTTVVAYVCVFGAILVLFGHGALFGVLAGVAVGVCWVLARWLIGQLSWKFAFVLRYAVNIAVVCVVWMIAEGNWLSVGASAKALINPHNLVVVLGYVIVLRPSSLLIGAILNPWLASVDTQGTLKSAGALIGYLERALILTFVLLAQWQAIGFLLTAKSILRFNDIKGVEQRALSEYVLLGTLLSFSTSIAIGLAVTKLLSVLAG
ncbi:hypothetical protein [Pseudomonas huanghezhanensis]|uniref:hypothetical protein n=1 Tax=Pseudomonas huanghezhanensis TaxID=3002903 RepID=UPI0022864999|nr:hypothetical protein [Pseudomonas sp. BSw22131]